MNQQVQKMEGSQSLMQNEFFNKQMTLLHNRIIEAQQSEKISKCTLPEFAQSIVKICALNGVTMVDIQFIQIMHQILSNAFPSVTLDDLMIAIEMNITNQFDKKINHFQTIDASYISDVLTLYLIHKGKAIIEYRNLQLKWKELNPPEPTDAEMEIKVDWMKMIHEHIEQWKQGKKTSAMLCSYRIVEWMHSNGIITDDMYSGEEWKQLRIQARKIIMQEQDITPTKISKFSERQQDLFAHSVTCELRRIIYTKYLIQQCNLKS